MKKLLFLVFLFPLLAQAQIILTVAGTGAAGFEGDGGPATTAVLQTPYAVVLDRNGNLYVNDDGNSRIRKISPAYNGTIVTVAGNGTAGYSGDGFEAVYAQLGGVGDIAVDWKGNLYLADANNNRIRKVSSTGIITTYAGTGAAGYNGDGIPATTARLNMPTGVATDDTGNVYVADRNNYRIRKIDTFGIITTVAGNGTAGFSPDGAKADTAALNIIGYPRIDKEGNLFLLDNIRIRKIDFSGIIHTIAGNGLGGYSGDGGVATDAKIVVAALSIDTFGNCYFADSYTARIRKIDTDGIITTVAGTGLSGYSGDWGNPLLAKLALPQGVAVAPNGEIFIGDVANNRVRMITTHVSAVPDVVAAERGICIYPNPAQGRLFVNAPGGADIAGVMVTDVLGRRVCAEVVDGVINIAGWADGLYFFRVAYGDGTAVVERVRVRN
jgi:hypothetical protein